MSESGKQPSHPVDSAILGGQSELFYTSHHPATSATHPAAAEVIINDNVLEPPTEPPHSGTDGILRRDFAHESFEPVAPFLDLFDYRHVGASQPPSCGLHNFENGFLESEARTENLAQCPTYHVSKKAGFSSPGEPGFQNQNDLWTEYITDFMQAPPHPRA